MSTKADWVDGWEIRPSGDGGFGVYDSHGMLIGPFGTREEPMAAALDLPKPRAPIEKKPKTRTPSDD